MAEQQIINYGSDPNDGTGDPLRDAFIKVDENFSNIWAAGPVGSNIVISNNTVSVVDTNGNLILSPNGIGSTVFKGGLVPVANNLYTIGSSNLRVRTLYVGIGGLDVTGNINTSGTFSAATFQAANIIANTISSTTGNVTIANTLVVSQNSFTSGNITTDAYFIGDGGLISNLSIEAGTQIVSGNSNVSVTAPSGPVSIGINGVSNVAVFTTTGVEVAANVSAAYFVGNGAGLTSVMADRGSDTNDWDTLTQMGTYRVNRVNWGGTIGTPLDSQVYVGLLQVSTAGDAVTQIFIPGTTLSGDQKIQFNRSRWSGTWTSWIKIVNDGQTIDAGSY